LVESAEKELAEAIENTQHATRNTINEALGIVETLIPAINNFFDNVLVMAEDEAVKQNRLALVSKIASLTEGLADLSYLEGF
jgi:glycyl-tRNA synthetase beta subunit